MYWHPGQAWQHRDCVVRVETVGGALKKSKKVAELVEKVVETQILGKVNGWDREAYNAYMREYMRKWRAEKKGKA